MKKSILFAITMVIASVANAKSSVNNSEIAEPIAYRIAETQYDNEGNANFTNVDAFNIAQIEVPARVRVIKGESYGLNISTLNKETEKSLRYTVTDGVLRFYANTPEALSNDPIVINLVVPSVPEIKTVSNLNKAENF